MQMAIARKYNMIRMFAQKFDHEKRKSRMFFGWQNGFLGKTRNIVLVNWNWILEKSAGPCLPGAPRLRH